MIGHVGLVLQHHHRRAGDHHAGVDRIHRQPGHIDLKRGQRYGCQREHGGQPKHPKLQGRPWDLSDGQVGPREGDQQQGDLGQGVPDIRSVRGHGEGGAHHTEADRHRPQTGAADANRVQSR